jgi:nucleotide-binding universal stress UspA family protein
MIRVKKILYPTDFSSYSNQAYFHAVGLAEAYGASLTVVYVHTPGSPGDRAHWENQLEQVRPANPKIPVSHVLLEGDPATEIARFAADAGIDVIVIGTRGRTGVDRLVLGSVAERVMREAPCTVLVVKLPKGVSGAEQPISAAITTSG